MSYHVGPPRRKRARVEADADADVANETCVQKDEQVWFSDGNIIVVASNKFAFRVHKGTLSLRSEVFRDLFSLGDTDAATAESETMDGCPIVHLTDWPEDIRHLLLVLCCGKNYYYANDAPTPTPFAVLASLIRTAHKYAIQDVLDDALSRLKKYYTNDLAEWRDPDARARYVTAAASDAPTAIHLARLTDTPSVLPPAFLVCNRLAETWDTAPDGAPVSRIAALSVPDQTRVIVARGLLVHARATRALHLLAAVPSAHCATRDACGAAREAPLDDLVGSSCLFESLMGDRHALTPMADIFWARLSDWTKFCEGCRAALVEEDERMIRLLWNLLPHVFALRIGVESWPSRPAAATATAGSECNIR